MDTVRSEKGGNKERKVLQDDIQNVKSKRRCLETDGEALLQSADDLAEKAATSRYMKTIINESLALRKSGKEKKKESLELKKYIAVLEERLKAEDK